MTNLPKFAMVFTADAKPLEAATAEVKKDLGAVSTEAAQASTSLEKHTAALERDATAARKAADAQRDLAAAEKAAREQVERATGVRPSTAGGPIQPQQIPNRPTPTYPTTSNPTPTTPQPGTPAPGGLSPQEIDDRRARYIPLYAAQRDYQRQLAEIQKDEQRGVLSASESSAASGKLTTSYERQVEAIKRADPALRAHGENMKLASHEAKNLTYQINDTVQSLALGMPISQVFLQQGPQIIQIYGGVGNTMKALTAALTPARLAMGGVSALAIAGALAWNDYLGAMKEVETAASGLGRATAGSGSSMEAAAHAGADAANISVSAARSMEVQFLRTGKIGSQNFEQLIGISKDFGVTLGIGAEDAGAKLSEMFADPAKAADTLYRQYGLINGSTAEYARRLAAQNDLSGAQRVLLDALPSRLADASEATTALGRAWASVANGASNAWEAIGRGVNTAIEGPTRDERIKELQAARARFAPTTSSFILGTLNGGSDKFERAQAELQILQAQRRQQEEDAERVRALNQRRAASTVAIGIAEQSPINAFQRQREALEDRLKAIQSGPAVGGESATQREMTARAIDAQTRALKSLITEEEKAARLGAIDIRMQSERNATVRAEIAASRVRIELAGQEVDVEARAANARRQVLDQAAADETRSRETRVRSLDAMVERQRFEVSLLGKTALEQERLRTEYDLTAQVKEDAFARGKSADTEELKNIRDKVAEYGRLKAAIEAATLGRQRGAVINSPADDERVAYLNQSAEQGRIREEAAIRRAGLHARSPAELAAVARREAELVVDPKENGQTRNLRIETAGKDALERAEKSLSDAQKERARSLDQTIAGQRLELELIGKTAGETERLRMQFNLTAQLREEAFRTGRKIDETELAAIQKKSAEYGKLADQVARARFFDDLQFEQDQLLRSGSEQNIAEQLRSAGQPIDFSSAEASAIRLTEALKEQRAAWEDVRDIGRDAIDSLSDSALGGFKDIESTFKDIGKDILGELNTLAIKNPIKNAIYGDANPTMASVGGLGGFFGILAGGKNPAMAGTAQAVGAMTVSAGTVMINGGVAGGAGGLPGLFKTGGNASLAAAGQTQTGIPLSEIAAAGGLKAKVSSEYAPRFQGLLNDLEAAGYNVSSLGEGGYSYRKVKGTDNLSKHAFGEALDINPRQNPWSNNFQSDLPANVNDLAKKNGLTWGGTWNKPDTMHFQVDKTANTASLALEKMASASGAATQGLGQFGGGLGQFSQQLVNAASSGGSAAGGGLLGIFGKMIGGISPTSSMWAPNTTFGSFLTNGFDVGGWTGNMDTKKVAGVVHGQEFVVNARTVAKPGVRAFLEGLNDNKPGYYDGGYVSVGQSPAYPQATSGANSASAPSTTTIHNYSSASIEHEETTDERGGRHSEFTIADAIGSGLAKRGGGAERTMGRVFGVKRKRIAR
ncbi:phage tail length tape measure family protein [Pararhizobium sp.]|uniref:phage tail length tape measure family protein n=1 Tax=Pararhizobium sp. TaxID=1977563 RepID=UPI003D0A0B2B